MELPSRVGIYPYMTSEEVNMKNLIRRTVYLIVAGVVVASSLSGCVVYPERGYHYDGYGHRYWDR